jgi:hypothetical protein
VQRERREQEYFVQWIKLKYPNILIAASANGGARNPREAANMKREGVLPGHPDIQVFKACKGFHGLLIELKAPKTSVSVAGKLSMAQKLILQQLNDEGYYARAAWGWLEAKLIAEWYLNE